MERQVDDDAQYKEFFKVVQIGDDGVGKTSLLRQYMEQTFSLQTVSTTGVEFSIKKTTIDSEKVKVQIYDTAGQERYREITKQFFRGARGALLVYDVTDESSFKNLSRWIHELSDSSRDGIVIVLVGNKSDLESQRKVSTKEGKRFAKEYNIPFFETSANNATNVNEVYEELFQKAYAQIKKEDHLVPQYTCSRQKFTGNKELKKQEEKKNRSMNQTSNNNNNNNKTVFKLPKWVNYFCSFFACE